MNRRLFLSLLGSSVAGQSVVNLDTHGDMQMPSGMDKASDNLLEAHAGVSGKISSVTTRSGGNLRHGTYLNETILTPDSIVKNPPRKLFTVTLPGDARGVEAQPLLIPSVTITNGEVHDLLLSATMGNQIYCHDANTGTPLWQIYLGNPILGSSKIDGWKINQYWGVLSTGVVEQGMLYVVSWTSPDGTPESATHELHEIDIRNGIQNKPSIWLTTASNIQRKQRASLAVVNGILFIPWGTIQETATGAHGFITAVDLKSWKVADELNLSKTGAGVGIWMAGQGLTVDDKGFLYAMTGNGSYDGANNFGECFVKLQYANGKLSVVKSWSPFRDADRGNTGGWDDMDLGSGGCVVIPELNLICGAGKDGVLYTLDLTTFQPKTPPIWFTFFPGFGVDANPKNIKDLNQNFGTNRSHHMHSTPIYWNGMLYCWGENSNLRVGSIDNSGKWKFLARSSEIASPYAPIPPGGMPGAFMALSATGNQNGIIWAIVPDGDANRTITTGRVFAFDAQKWGAKLADGDISVQRLWMSDPHHIFNKFMPPVISGGKIYVATYSASIDVYGL